MAKTQLRDGRVAKLARDVKVVLSKSNDPRLDEKAYDLRSRIYTCYVLCTSMLCLIPVVPYYMSKELYKRGHKKGAAISMEIFKYSHCMLVFTLLFIKVFLFLLKKNPALLNNFFVKNQDAAVIVAAVLCALPVFSFVVMVRYFLVYDEVKTTGSNVFDVLLARSYLNDVSDSVPVLVCYAGDKGPIFTTESKKKRRRCGADVVYDVYLYSTSYLLVLPSCFSLLCRLFLQKKNRVALSVSRLLGVASHVLLLNAIVVCAITLAFEAVFSTPIGGIGANSIGIALLNGVLISSFILFIAITFCYYEIGNNVYDSSKEISDNIARSVLKFGLLTISVNCVCSLFRHRFQLNQGFEYEQEGFAYGVFRRLLSAIFLVPACCWQIYEALRIRGNNRAAAIAKRAWVHTEVFIGNFFILTLVFYGMISMCTPAPYVPIEKSAALIGLMGAFCFLLVAVAKDLFEVLNRTLRVRDTKWENVVMNDDDLDFHISSTGIMHLMVLGAMYVVNFLGEKTHTSSKEKLQHNFDDTLSTTLSLTSLDSVDSCLQSKHEESIPLL